MATIDHAHSALIVVDMQPDFMEGGALATEDGSAIVPPVAELMASERFGVVAGTQDWHPAGHISFASSHAGRAPFETIDLYGHEQVLWPDHCVQNSPGAALHTDLPWEVAGVIIRKGNDPAVDSYSGFLNNWNENGERPPTGLAGYLRERGVTDVYVCGLARDYCVLWTAQDAADAGFRTHFIWDLTRPVDSAGDDDVRRGLDRAGITVVNADELTNRA